MLQQHLLRLKNDKRGSGGLGGEIDFVGGGKQGGGGRGWVSSMEGERGGVYLVGRHHEQVGEGQAYDSLIPKTRCGKYH